MKLFLTAKEAGEALGLSPEYLRRQAHKGTIPHHRIGRQVRFTQEDLEKIAARSAKAAKA